MRHFTILLFFALIIASCTTKNDTKNPGSSLAGASGTKLFTTMTAAETGIAFRNDLEYDRAFNIYRYRNFYNGGGVSIGDVDNDGLQDLFFTSNMGQNKLYRNLGDFKFEDISEKAGITGKGSWSTGVSMADVNGDGWLDIYVCNSGNPRESEKEKQSFSRENELFINNKNGTFTESAQAYGLADRGLTTHAAFFDYDRDGDLDVYVLNNSFRAIGSFDLRQNLRHTRDSLGGHKLYRNEGMGAGGHPTFKDVSTEAGILGSVIAFGLGVTVGDVNQDGWQDIYVSNDFFERDYLYYNNGNGTFREDLPGSLRHISAASMGADMADINNDALPDIFVTDMLPEDDYRLKTSTSFDSPDRFSSTKDIYYNQFTRNMLHLNNGLRPDKTDGKQVHFSDIACMATCEATDWSWGALMFDMDNDGWKDIFVANGVAQDLTDQDYLLFISDPAVQREITAGGNVDYKRLIDSIPSVPLPNFAFHNNRDLTFADKSKEWGLDVPSFSNGSAYGDLDNDGDLDLIVNCNNGPALVYRSEARQALANNNYLKFNLLGEGGNTAAIGTKICLRAAGQNIYLEQMPMRGFQSSMDPRPHFGLGNVTTIDTVYMEWPNGKATLLTNVPANQVLSAKQAEANLPNWLPLLRQKPQPGLFQKMAQSNWKHQESTFNDWDRDRLLYLKYSTEGPKLAIGDANGDGLQDYYACGAAGQSGALMLQQKDGTFSEKQQKAFASDAAAEDADATFFDADNDGDMDLYVASGSNEMAPMAPTLTDRLYINDGKGNFTRKLDALPPQKPFASAAVRPTDYDGDGDVDVFVAMRLMPGQVGVPVGGFLLSNDGKGNFRPTQMETFRNLGMPTDAIWADVDADKDKDLVICGEWMPIKIFVNNGGRFSDATAQMGLDNTNGLWKTIASADFNKDGRPDFALGNMGLNTRLEATPEHPMELSFNDFDLNGTPEQFISRYTKERMLPYTLRGDMVANLPALKKKYLKFKKYGNQTLEDIFSPAQRDGMIRQKAGHLANAVLLSQPNGGYQLVALPNESQFAPLFGMVAGDFDRDGNQDILAGGNFEGFKPEFGYVDADYGTFLKGDGKGGFKAMRSAQSGLILDGEVRDIQFITVRGRTMFAVAINNAPIQFWAMRQ
jgi:enediyne biosynthesis protein E4